MDVYSAKFAIMIIIVLVGILTFQVISNSEKAGMPVIDSETCEIYIIDPKINAKQYLNEFDEKCLEFKNLNP